ncbi:MAG: DinB family protein [Vicinamibacterales bacterium]
MTIPTTPYSHHIDGRDPLVAMRDSIRQFQDVTAGWTPEQWERPIAPGKWTARQVIIHLAQTELALGTRARMALTTADFKAQSFDQDKWLARELGVSGPDALNVFVVLATLNLALYASLTGADRETPLTHDEYGAMTVNWIIYQEAGHQVHHLKQLLALEGSD